MQKWIINNVDAKKVREFSHAFGIKPIIAHLLLARGINSLKAAEAFLNPDLSSLPSPYLLPDMDKCVERIRQAVSRNEKIFIFGDRDVDGITSISIMYRTLKLLGAENVFWYIPSNEGYGLNNAVIEKYKKEHAIDLMITVDCGISNIAEVEFAKSLGIDVIITDHHEPPESVPECVAVVNPKLKSSKYHFRDLAGCAVAFKVAHALLFSYGHYYNEELAAVDIETTGLHPKYSEICEIGAVITKNSVIVAKFQSLIQTKKPIPPEVTAIHGITNEMCKNAPSLPEVLSNLMKFIGNRRLLIHNASFDLGFLKNAFKNALKCTLTNDYIDTLQMSRQYFPFKSHALTALVNDLKIDIQEHHRALSDAIACACVFWRLQEMSDARLKHFLEEHLDMVSIGTLADVMPLTFENRVLVKRGLEVLPRSNKIGVRKLIEGALREKNTLFLNSKYITWNITPLLNAAGRLGKADVACRLLLSDKSHDAEMLYKEMLRLNSDRKELQELNIEKFNALLSSQCDTKKDKILIVAADNVEHGVTGIVASDIVKRYKKPVILFVVKDDIAQGAGRSVNGFDLLGAVEKVSGLLLKYGGHRTAVGLSLRTKDIEEFRRRMNDIVSQSALEEAENVIKIDAVLNPKEIKPELLRQIEQLEPFGLENPPPVFLIKELGVTAHSRVGYDGSHLRVKFFKNDSILTAVGWGMGDLNEMLDEWKSVDVAAQIESNLWREKEYIQLQIIGIRESAGELH